MQSSKEIQFPWNAIESEKKKLHVYFSVAFSNDNVISFACFSAILAYSALLNYEFFFRATVAHIEFSQIFEIEIKIDFQTH